MSTVAIALLAAAQALSVSIEDRAATSKLLLLHNIARARPLRLKDLADELGVHQSYVSRHVRFLEDDNLVTVQPDPHDGRAALVELTEEGQSSLDTLADDHERAVERSLSSWKPEDRHSLQVLLARLTAELIDQGLTDSSSPSQDMPSPASGTNGRDSEP